MINKACDSTSFFFKKKTKSLSDSTKEPIPTSLDQVMAIVQAGKTPPGIKFVQDRLSVCKDIPTQSKMTPQPKVFHDLL